jgi:methylmalonyl-CoA mutase
VWFQEIERAGGQEKALNDGLIAERLASTWEKRKKDLARRKEPITGVSEFPNLDEKTVRREPAPVRDHNGLPKVRRDQDFEELRARSDAHLETTGVRPRMFLAALGTPAAHTARATFTANLFQAGGVEPVIEQVDADDVAEAFKNSGTTVACLCSSDKVYAEQAEAVAAALKAAGATRVFLAGRPGDTAGVDEFVHAGGDAIAVLSSVLDHLGVA